MLVDCVSTLLRYKVTRRFRAAKAVWQSASQYISFDSLTSLWAKQAELDNPEPRNQSNGLR